MSIVLAQRVVRDNVRILSLVLSDCLAANSTFFEKRTTSNIANVLAAANLHASQEQADYYPDLISRTKEVVSYARHALNRLHEDVNLVVFDAGNAYVAILARTIEIITGLTAYATLSVAVVYSFNALCDRDCVVCFSDTGVFRCLGVCVLLILARWFHLLGKLGDDEDIAIIAYRTILDARVQREVIEYDIRVEVLKEQIVWQKFCSNIRSTLFLVLSHACNVNKSLDTQFDTLYIDGKFPVHNEFLKRRMIETHDDIVQAMKGTDVLREEEYAAIIKSREMIKEIVIGKAPLTLSYSNPMSNAGIRQRNAAGLGCRTICLVLLIMLVYCTDVIAAQPDTPPGVQSIKWETVAELSVILVAASMVVKYVTSTHTKGCRPVLLFDRRSDIKYYRAVNLSYILLVAHVSNVTRVIMFASNVNTPTCHLVVLSLLEASLSIVINYLLQCRAVRKQLTCYRAIKWPMYVDFSNKQTSVVVISMLMQKPLEKTKIGMLYAEAASCTLQILLVVQFKANQTWT